MESLPTFVLREKTDTANDATERERRKQSEEQRRGKGKEIGNRANRGKRSLNV